MPTSGGYLDNSPTPYLVSQVWPNMDQLNGAMISLGESVLDHDKSRVYDRRENRWPQGSFLIRSGVLLT